MRWFRWKKRTMPSVCCYCPTCMNELISSGSFVSDEELVMYKCVECHTTTEWLFDAPVPILLYVDGERYKHTKEGFMGGKSKVRRH